MTGREVLMTRNLDRRQALSLLTPGENFFYACGKLSFRLRQFAPGRRTQVLEERWYRVFDPVGIESQNRSFGGNFLGGFSSNHAELLRRRRATTQRWDSLIENERTILHPHVGCQ